MRSSWLSADLTFKMELAQRESSIYLRMRMIGTMHSEIGNWFAKKIGFCQVVIFSLFCQEWVLPGFVAKMTERRFYPN